MMKPDFEATWIPRIGEGATSELRHCRRVGMSANVAGLVFASGAGIALAGNFLDKVLGALFIVGAVASLATFINCRRRIAAALSEWFGVRIVSAQMPLMNPVRFDAWRERMRLVGRDGRTEGTQTSTTIEPLKLKYDHKLGPIRWSRRAERDWS
jgi:hypothetical protein